MPKTITLPATQNIKNPTVSILPADGTAFKAIYAAGANDAVVKSLMLNSTDTAAQNVQLAYNNGSADFILGTVPVPALSGTNGVAPSVDALSRTWLPGLPYDQNGKSVLPLQAGYILKARSLVAITAAKQIDVTTVVEEY
jgi:hypothetical protein